MMSLKFLIDIWEQIEVRTVRQMWKHEDIFFTNIQPQHQSGVSLRVLMLEDAAVPISHRTLCDYFNAATVCNLKWHSLNLFSISMSAALFGLQYGVTNAFVELFTLKWPRNALLWIFLALPCRQLHLLFSVVSQTRSFKCWSWLTIFGHRASVFQRFYCM